MNTEQQAIAAEEERTLKVARQRHGEPLPDAIANVNRKIWPQEIPVRDLLRIVEAWAALARGVLRHLGVEVLGEPEMDAVAVRGAFAALSRMGPDALDFGRRSASDTVLVRHWEEHKVVYTIHPGLLEGLIDTTGSDRVPASVLRRLPHPNPLVLFPRAVPVSLSDGSPGLMRGFFVTGTLTVPRGMVRTSSADPEATGLQLCAFSQVGTSDSPPKAWDLSSVSVPLNGEFTVAEAAGRSADGWDADPDSALGATPELVGAWTREILRICLPVLLYACSSEPDRRSEASLPMKRKAKRKAPQPPRLYQLGYRVGPALLAPLRGSQGHSGGTSGRTVVPHMRRAHWHTYRVGPGRQDSYVRWLPPISVNPEGQPASVPTVIAVNPAREGS
jgi:hypothetical protein